MLGSNLKKLLYVSSCFVLAGYSNYYVRKSGSPASSVHQAVTAPDRLILSRSICAIPHFDFSLGEMDAFSWISNHQFISKREYGDTDHSHSPYSHGVYEYDVLTHKMKLNMGFTQALGEGTTPVDVRFSWDGRYLIEDRDLSLYYYVPNVFSSDGSIDFSLPTFAADPCWLPDSRLLLFEPGVDPGVKGMDNQVWLIDIHMPDPIVKISFDPAAIRTLKQSGVRTSSMTSLTHERLIADNYVGAINVGYPVTSLKGMILHLGQRITPLKTFSVRLPTGMQLRWRTYSPKGDRILWGLSPIPDGKQQSYWISRIDGSAWWKAGELEEDNLPSPQSNAGPRWLPDGHHFSFFHNGSLYITDINRN